MKMILKITSTFAFLLLVTATKSLATGPIVVNNGGGLAELKAIYLHQNLGAFVASCLIKTNICGLRAGEAAAMQLLVSNHRSEAVASQIRFEANIEEPVLTAPRLGAPIQVLSSALYTSSGLPQPTGEIGAFIFAARWSHVSKVSLPNLLIRAREIFSNFQDRSEHIPVGEFNSAVTFHLSHWRFQNTEQILMMLEDKDKTIDITARVEKALPCGSLLAWNWQNIRTATAEPVGKSIQAVIAIDGRAGCHQNTPRTLVIDILIRDDHFVQDQIQVSLRGP